MKNIIIASVLFALAALLMAGCGGQKPIGGESDEYGCMVAAGYHWNDSVGACIREWELDEGQRKAARIVILPLSYRVSIVDVMEFDCEGCYVVTYQRNDNFQMDAVRLHDWKRYVEPVEEEIFCRPEQRGAEICTMEYRPVCGLVQVQCIKAPCPQIRQTFGNRCEACANSLTVSYTEGECPD